MNKGTEMVLNTMGSQNKNIRVKQTSTLGVVGNKVFRQSRIIPLEIIEGSRALACRNSLGSLKD